MIEFGQDAWTWSGCLDLVGMIGCGRMIGFGQDDWIWSG